MLQDCTDVVQTVSKRLKELVYICNIWKTADFERSMLIVSTKITGSLGCSFSR